MFERNKVGKTQAYVIVCGNEKGGSGKTTTAMHLIVALLNAGHTVASVDLDSRQQSLTRYIENRNHWIQKFGLSIPVSNHFNLNRWSYDSALENENAELECFSEILQSVESAQDFVVIDTPGHDSYMMRLAHSMADSLITPLNDSYVDFDVLGNIDPLNGNVTQISHYAAMVREARRHRRNVDNGLLDWVIVRNRTAHLASRNTARMEASLKSLAMQLGCRLASGISERVVFRELFPKGLTVLDECDRSIVGRGHALSHLAARQEIRSLVTALRLPIDNAARKRADARKIWMNKSSKPVTRLKIMAD